MTRLPLLDDESKPSVQDVDIIGDIIDCKLFHESSSPGRRLGTRNGREALYLRSKLFFFLKIPFPLYIVDIFAGLRRDHCGEVGDVVNAGLSRT